MKKIWDLIEKCMHFCVFRIMRLRISEEAWNKLCQFVKFGIVGLSNMLIYFIVYVISVALSVNYLVSSLIGFFVSVINSYYSNDRYVFTEEEESRIWWKTFIKTFLAYTGTGLIPNNLLLILWVRVCGIHE